MHDCYDRSRLVVAVPLIYACVVVLVSVVLYLNRRNTHDVEALSVLNELASHITRTLHSVKVAFHVSSSRESYTLNKRDVYIKMRDSNGRIYDADTLKYVILHEIAHCLCPENGHTQLYKQIFDELLLKAHKFQVLDMRKVDIGLYSK